MALNFSNFLRAITIINLLLNLVFLVLICLIDAVKNNNNFKSANYLALIL